MLLVAAVLLAVVEVLRRAVVLLRVLDVTVVPWVCGGVALREADNAPNNAKTKICFMVAPVIRLKSLNSGTGTNSMSIACKADGSHCVSVCNGELVRDNVASSSLNATTTACGSES